MRIETKTWALKLATVVSERATCQRRAVGCVLLSRDSNILATGYNGSPRGFTHCIDEPCAGMQSDGADSCIATHAEINALLQCADVKEVYLAAVTCFPCFRCLKALLNTGIKVLVFSDVYPGYEDMYPLLKAAKVAYWRL